MSNLSLQTAYQKALLTLIAVAVGVLFISNMTHAEQNTKSTTDFEAIGTLNEDNLSTYVALVGEDFYQQQQLIADYFKLYQQKQDERGFNVWHLRGYMPQFRTLNQAHQDFAAANATFLAEKPENNLVDSISALETISSRLMIAMRENDPASYQAAFELNKQHTDLVAEALTRHQLDEHIQHIPLR